MRKLLTILFLFISIVAYPTTYYVSTTGSDSYAGTIGQPFATLQKAINVAVAGDIVYIRGGTYYQTTGIDIDPTDAHGATGTLANPIYYYNYPGEVPIFDFSLVVPHGPGTYYNTGLSIQSVQYIKFKGFTVRNVWQGDYDGYYVSCQGIATAYAANLTFENITVHNIAGRAFGHSSGAWNAWDGEGALWTSDNTKWINCDAYDLCDTINYYVYTAPGYPDWEIGDTAWYPGNSADGWKTHGYQGNKFEWIGCRAWNYSDDGIDPSGECYKIFDSCWIMSTDKYETICHYEQPGHINPSDMEGNGIKMTSPASAYYFPDLLGADTILVEVSNCMIAYCVGTALFNNLYLSGTTYVDNNAQIFNNTVYRNDIGFFENSPYTNANRGVNYKNNIAIYSASIYEAGIYNPSIYNESHNNWDATMETGGWPGWEYADDITITDADFVSVDSSQIHATRKADGSLPDITFLTLIAGSDAIDYGTDVGLAFNGVAPDIGYAESGTADLTATDITAYTFPEMIGVAVINATLHTVAITVEYGTDVTGLIATFTLSTGATAKIGATSQVSGTTANDFTGAVVYAVTAEDGVTVQNWTITVTVDTDPVPTVATIATTSASAKSISAVVYGNLYSLNGGTFVNKGICISTSVSPTVSDALVYAGVGLGSFSSTLRGLTPATTYHVRAFATTAEGGAAYGSDVEFKTPKYSVPVNGSDVLIYNNKIVIVK